MLTLIKCVGISELDENIYENVNKTKMQFQQVVNLE